MLQGTCGTYFIIVEIGTLFFVPMHAQKLVDLHVCTTMYCLMFSSGIYTCTYTRRKILMVENFDESWLGKFWQVKNWWIGFTYWKKFLTNCLEFAIFFRQKFQLYSTCLMLEHLLLIFYLCMLSVILYWHTYMYLNTSFSVITIKGSIFN